MRNGLLCSLVLLLVLLSAGCAEEDLLPADRRTGDTQLTDIWITVEAQQESLTALQGTVAALQQGNTTMASAIATQESFVLYLATRPAPIVTPIGPGATPTPYRPVLGSVLVEDGRCCTGGPAGALLPLAVALEAEHLEQAPVSEMRLAAGAHCLDEEAIATLPWQPFVAQTTVTVSVPLNWSTTCVTAQFRDATGYLSLIYADEIAIEGSPPSP